MKKWGWDKSVSANKNTELSNESLMLLFILHHKI